MKLAPALTWLHLFPFGTQLDCPKVPAWFSALVRPEGEAGSLGRALVLFDAGADVVARDSGTADGVVVVNGNGLTEDTFKKAGFTYARRFAAVPNLANARWFIPLDIPAVTAAGFGLYSPAKRIARLKLSAVRLAARVGLGGWYRDEVWVAARTEPPLERLIRRVLPGKEPRLALSAGAPEPARNRKVSAAVIGIDGTTLAFVKLPTSPLAIDLVHKEADALAALGRQLDTDQQLVPRLLFAGDSDGRYALVQAPLPGKPTAAKLTGAHRRFLTSLQTPTDKRPATSFAFFQTLLTRVNALGEDASDLADALHAAEPVLAGSIVPRTVIHGDFAPWNVRLRAGNTSVSAFDWEYGVIDGLPLIDETHFDIQIGLLLNDWTPQRAMAELDMRTRMNTDFPAATVRALQVTYFVDSITRLLEEGYVVDDEMIVWYRKVLGLRVASLARVPAGAA